VNENNCEVIDFVTGKIIDQEITEAENKKRQDKIKANEISKNKELLLYIEKVIQKNDENKKINPDQKVYSGIRTDLVCGLEEIKAHWDAGGRLKTLSCEIFVDWYLQKDNSIKQQD